ncbi:MAG: enoyl-CoA hydratase/isomerase family protein [Gammaproteobacteria bacterium]
MSLPEALSSALPTTQWLELGFSEGWLRVYLNAPKTRNALSEELSAELKTVLRAVRTESTVRGITLRGRGEVFCAGGDLKAFAAVRELPAQEARQTAVATSLRGAEVYHLVHTAPQVVVALIEGAAIAGGLGLACAADFAFATADAKFAFSETRIGLTPAQIAPYVIGKVGVRNARRLLLTGAYLNGAQALESGLVDAVANDSSELDDLERTLIEQVLRCAPEAVGVTKQVIDDVVARDVQAFQHKAAEHFAQCLVSDEGREGVASFFEKRSPSWATCFDKDNSDSKSGSA